MSKNVGVGALDDPNNNECKFDYFLGLSRRQPLQNLHQQPPSNQNNNKKIKPQRFKVLEEWGTGKENFFQEVSFPA